MSDTRVHGGRSLENFPFVSVEISESQSTQNENWGTKGGTVPGLQLLRQVSGLEFYWETWNKQSTNASYRRPHTERRQQSLKYWQWRFQHRSCLRPKETQRFLRLLQSCYHVREQSQTLIVPTVVLTTPHCPSVPAVRTQRQPLNSTDNHKSKKRQFSRLLPYG